MNEDKILAAIAELNESIKARIDGIEGRLEAVEKINRKQARLAEDLYKHQRKQSEDIDELFRRIDALCESDSVVWHSQDGRKIGLNKQAAYDVFRDCGYDRLEALRLIDAAGRLVRGSKNEYGKNVWLGDKYYRAIVVYLREE